MKKLLFLLYFIISSTANAQYNQWPGQGNAQFVKLKNGNTLYINKSFCPICRGYGNCVACQYSYPCRMCGGTMRCTQCGGSGGATHYVVYTADGQYCAQADQFGNPTSEWRSVFALQKMKEPERRINDKKPQKYRWECCSRNTDYGTGAVHRCSMCNEPHRIGSTHGHDLYK